MKKKIRVMLYSILLLALVFTGSVEAKKIVYYGHRGLQYNYPENTLASFSAAMKAGFDGIEFDVFLTNSKDFLVFHDSTLSRMCKRGGMITSVSKKNRNKYPIRSGSGLSKLNKSQRLIPTFEETVQLMAAKNGVMYIHLKNLGKYSSTDISRMAAILKQYKMENKCVIFCANISKLKQFQKKGFKVGYLEATGGRSRIRRSLKNCIKYKLDSYVMFMPNWLTKDDVKLCHKHNIQVGAYKVRTSSEAKRLKNMQVDFMFGYGKLFR